MIGSLSSHDPLPTHLKDAMDLQIIARQEDEEDDEDEDENCPSEGARSRGPLVKKEVLSNYVLSLPYAVVSIRLTAPDHIPCEPEVVIESIYTATREALIAHMPESLLQRNYHQWHHEAYK